LSYTRGGSAHGNPGGARWELAARPNGGLTGDGPQVNRSGRRALDKAWITRPMRIIDPCHCRTHRPQGRPPCGS